jgi:hypothetical protein
MWFSKIKCFKNCTIPDERRKPINKKIAKRLLPNKKIGTVRISKNNPSPMFVKCGMIKSPKEL